MISTWMLGAALAASPACVDVFDEVDETIRTNYVALALYRENASALVDAAERRHSTFRARAERAAEADVLGCTRILQAYVNAYDDPHLFLNSAPVISEADAARMRADAPTLPFSPHLLREQAVSATGRGPLVGVWAGDGFEAAIIPEGDGGFVAVVVGTQSDDWSVGDIAAHFDHHEGDPEAVRYRAEDRTPVRTGYHIVSDAILAMPPANWGRIEPAPHGVIGDWDPHAPRAPRFEMISPEVAWLSVPSLSPRRIGDALEVIAQDHRDDIIGSELLVVDLRGNSGGSSLAMAPLDPFIMTSEVRDGYAADTQSPVLLASPDTAAHYANIVDQMEPGLERSVFEDLVRRLEDNPGSLQPMLTDPAHIAIYHDARLPEALFDEPRQVAFLVDGDVVSAGEAALLRAGRSTRVTSFGANTRGSIDYQQVLMVAVGDGALRFALGYPLMADNAQLPAGAYNEHGVPVDVPLHGDSSQWPAQVLAYYGLD